MRTPLQPYGNWAPLRQTRPRALLTPILIAIYLILSLGIQVFVARQDPAVRINTVHVPATAPSHY
jgi:hypothetical protein